MKIHEIMTHEACCVGPEDSLVQAAGVMRQLDVGAVPVCDHDKLSGMLTDRDIAVRAVADALDPRETRVREVMTPGIVYVFDDDDVDDALRIMEENQVRRLPVMSRDKRLVGMVSLGDVSVRASAGLSGEALREVSQPGTSWTM